MAWGSKTQIASSISVDSNSVYDYGATFVTLNPGETAHIQVKADFPVTPTDDLECYLFGTLDDSSEDWDTEPFMFLGTIQNDNDPGYLSAIVNGVYKFRIGFLRSGTTDTITADAWYRANGISI